MRKLYAALGSTLFTLLRPAIRAYFKNRQNKRVRIVAIDDEDNILLVKGWFGRQRWELPGGGVNKNENPIDAAARELHEETGIAAFAQNLYFVEEFLNTDTATPYTVVLYSTRAADNRPKTPMKYRAEIIGLQWFPVKNLPENISPLVSIGLHKAAKLEKTG